MLTTTKRALNFVEDYLEVFLMRTRCSPLGSYAKSFSGDLWSLVLKFQTSKPKTILP